jgi:hypothetical protein
MQPDKKTFYNGTQYAADNLTAHVLIKQKNCIYLLFGLKL